MALEGVREGRRCSCLGGASPATGRRSWVTQIVVVLGCGWSQVWISAGEWSGFDQFWKMGHLGVVTAVGLVWLGGC